MTTVTVTINTRTKRAQHLLTIVEEMAKIDRGINIESFEDSLQKSLREAKTGKVKLLKQREL